MDIIGNLWLGLQTAASATNLLYCLLGVFLGTAIGVLPGLGPVATIAILFARHLRAATHIGADHAGGHLLRAQYGGSTTAILVNLLESRLRW
jgi:putative tricarboxylic transport membrane protein